VQVDAIPILTSGVREHGEPAAAAYRAGKHVLVEKPLATSLDQAAPARRTTSQASDRLLVCAPHVLLSPTYRQMHERLAAGQVGEVEARAARSTAGQVPGGASGSTSQAEAHSSISASTTSPACADSSARLSASRTALVGTAIKSRPLNGTMMPVTADDNAHVLLDFGNEGFYGSVTTGFTIQKYGRAPAIELYGLEGSMNMLGDDWAPRGFEFWRSSVGHWEIHEEQAPDWPWTDGLNHLVSCIEPEVPSATRPEQAYHVLEVMLAAMQSSRPGPRHRDRQHLPRPPTTPTSRPSSWTSGAGTTPVA
jgi:predicted dehydrogenase